LHFINSVYTIVIIQESSPCTYLIRLKMHKELFNFNLIERVKLEACSTIIDLNFGFGDNFHLFSFSFVNCYCISLSLSQLSGSSDCLSVLQFWGFIYTKGVNVAKWWLVGWLVLGSRLWFNLNPWFSLDQWLGCICAF
jgi:hypothetical protein